MKKFIQITGLILVYILLCGKSCDNQEQYDASRLEKKIDSERDSLTSVFSSDTLPAATIRSFEEAAMQKFLDFTDFTNILADTANAPDFKAQAKNMISGLFISGNNLLRVAHKGMKIQRELTINDMVRTGILPCESSCTFIPDSVTIIRSLEKVSDSIFSGTLAFSLLPLPQVEGQPRIHCPSGGRIDIFLAKRKKKFGSDTLRVWNILLGDMELR